MLMVANLDASRVHHLVASFVANFGASEVASRVERRVASGGDFRRHA
jgi:hypothetical protein